MNRHGQPASCTDNSLNGNSGQVAGSLWVAASFFPCSQTLDQKGSNHRNLEGLINMPAFY